MPLLPEVGTLMAVPVLSYHRVVEMSERPVEPNPLCDLIPNEERRRACQELSLLMRRVRRDIRNEILSVVEEVGVGPFSVRFRRPD